MEIKQIHALINNCSLPGNCDNAGLTETHISWIILTDDFAYKIKRPVKYSFVDFSSIERRKHFCQKELKLNRRLAPEMYLDVLPVTKNMVEAETGNGEDEIIDFAVQIIYSCMMIRLYLTASNLMMNSAILIFSMILHFCALILISSAGKI